MPVVRRAQQQLQQCANCPARVPKLGRLVMVSPSGRRLHLSVCRFCYAQLAPVQKTSPLKRR